MSFNAKNPLIAPNINNIPPTPPKGTRGIFATPDGWKDIDDNGTIHDIGGNDGVQVITVNEDIYSEETFDIYKEFDDYIKAGEYVFITNEANLDNKTYKLTVSVSPSGDGLIYNKIVYQQVEAWDTSKKTRTCKVYNDKIVESEEWEDYTPYTKTESDAKHEDLQNQIYNVSDTANAALSEAQLARDSANYAYGMASELSNSKADKTELEEKADKTTVEYWGIVDTDISLIYYNNTEIRYHSTPDVINFILADGEYDLVSITGVSFKTGATPPEISYTNSGIIQWVGTDCSLDNDGFSLFIPSSDTQYDIVIYFNGVHFVGLVNGYKTAVGNKGTAEAVSE